MTSPVLSVVLPQADERFAHYLGRVAQRNHYSSPEWLLRIANVQQEHQGWKVGLRRAQHDPSISKQLAELLGIETDSLDGMRLMEVGGSTWNRQVTLGGHFVDRNVLRPLQRRYCPTCQNRGDPDTKLLDVAFYLACPKHGCWIVERCGCGEELTWETGSLIFCKKCGRSEAAKPSHAPEQLIELARHLHDLYHGKASLSQSAHYDLSSFLDLMRAVSCLEINRPTDARWRYNAEHFESDVLVQYCESAWRWIVDYEGFKNEFGSLTHRRLARNGDLPNRASYAELHFAILEVSDANVRRIVQGWLDDAAQTSRSSNASLTSTLEGRRPFTLEESAWILGTSPHNIRQLIASNHLSCLPSLGKKQRRLISLDSMETLCGMFAASCSQQSDIGWIALNASFRNPGVGTASGISEVVSSVLAGKLEASWTEGLGIDGAWVHFADTGTKSEPVSSSVGSGPDLNVEQVATRLGTYPSAIYRLVASGFINPKVILRSRRTVMTFTWQQIEEFHSSYIFSGELAKQLKVPRSTLVHRLMSLGVMPITGPSIDRSLIYMFRRDDVSHVSTEVLNRQISFDSRSGRRPNDEMRPYLMTSREVGKLLGLGAQKLGLVVQGGFLKQSPQSYMRCNQRLFEPTIVAEYLAKYTNNPDLLRLDDAFQQTQRSKASFIRDFISTGLVETVNAGAGHIYVTSESLRNALVDDHEWLPLARASEVLQIERSKLKNLRGSNTIKTKKVLVNGKEVHLFPIRDCLAWRDEPS